jgi:hypothetical protein
MQLRNRKINASAKHQLKILHLNKQYFENENTVDQYNEQNQNSCSYIDPKIVGCANLYDSKGSINLRIFLKNIFLAFMLFSIYASLFTYSLQVNYNTTLNNSNIQKFEVALTKPDYNKINTQGLKIVSIIFSTNNIKTKYYISKNIKNLYKSLVRLDYENCMMMPVYPKWLMKLSNYTNSSMIKLDEYMWMKNGNVSNTYSLLKYGMHNPYNYVSININRNESILNPNFYPYLIVL